MVYPAHVVHVLIASPSDVADERKALREAIWEFNDEHTPTNKVVLLPRTWERTAHPDSEPHPRTSSTSRSSIAPTSRSAFSGRGSGSFLTMERSRRSASWSG